MRLLSWNVNGLRACTKKGFVEWLGSTEVDVLGLQEVRALPEQLEDHVRRPEGWHTRFSPAERKGYSGVGLFSRIEPDAVETSIGHDAFDAEGRVQLATFGQLLVANIYFPNGSGKNRDNSRIPFKLDFYRRLFDLLDADMRAGRPIIVMGDFNTAHRDIDLARPKQNHKTSGFCPEEREELGRRMRSYWIEFARNGAPGGGVDGALPEWTAWDESLPDASRLMILDTETDGSVRMSPHALSRESILARVADDPRFPDETSRCALLADVGGRGADLSAAELARGGCRVGSVAGR